MVCSASRQAEGESGECHRSPARAERRPRQSQQTSRERQEKQRSQGRARSRCRRASASAGDREDGGPHGVVVACHEQDEGSPPWLRRTRCRHPRDRPPDSTRRAAAYHSEGIEHKSKIVRLAQKPRLARQFRQRSRRKGICRYGQSTARGQRPDRPQQREEREEHSLGAEAPSRDSPDRRQGAQRPRQSV